MSSDLTVCLVRDAVSSSVPDFIGALNGLLSQAGCPEDVRRMLDTAADEVLSNIVDYAYPSGGGTIEMLCEAFQGSCTLCFADSGIPFDPLSSEDPDISAVSENGGYGIFLTKALMDTVAYEYSDGHNRLTLKKVW